MNQIQNKFFFKENIFNSLIKFPNYLFYLLNKNFFTQNEFNSLIDEKKKLFNKNLEIYSKKYFQILKNFFEFKNFK